MVEATVIPAATETLHTPEALYLDLMKKCLTRSISVEQYELLGFPTGYLPTFLRRWLAAQPLRFVRHTNPARRREGRDWPLDGETMIGLPRLDHLQTCITDVIRRGVPGDLIETGVWRGGSTILMRAVLKAYAVTDRTVWVADSFQGLPKPNRRRYPADTGSTLWTRGPLAISLEQVQQHFARYGLLDGQVRFLPGWFRDTLPTAPIERLAVLRLDGDLYESTMDALRSLYPKLSVGGYAIIDDYGAVPACKQAVHDFRGAQGMTEEIQPVDWTCVYWQRQR